MKRNQEKCSPFGQALERRRIEGNRLHARSEGACSPRFARATNSFYILPPDRKTYPFRVKPTRVVHYREYPPCSVKKKALYSLQIHQKHIKANAYKTLVRPQIEYASTIWDPFTQENQNKIEMVQRRAAGFFCNSYRREASVTTMLDELGWRSLKQRRADQRLMLYKIVTNLVEVDLSKELIPLTRHF